MTVERSDDLVACVVAWHNRNPLARRITRAQVQPVGLLSLPFSAPGQGARALPQGAQNGESDPHADSAGSLRERAQARSRQAPTAPGAAAAAPPPPEAPAQSRSDWQPAFAEAIGDPISRRSVARWVLRHASERRPGPADAPARELQASGHDTRAAGVVRLWLYSAAIDLGARRVQVLVSPLLPPHVLGPRLLDQTRLTVAAASLMLMVGALVLLAAPTGWPGPAALQQANRATAMPVAAAGPQGASAPARTESVPASALAAAASAPAIAATEMAVAAPAVTAPSAAQAASAGGVALTDAAAAAATDPAVAAIMAAAMTRPAPAAYVPEPEASAPERPPVARPTRERPVRLLPALDEETRLAAREASDAARAERLRLAGGTRAAAATSAATGPVAAASPATAGPPRAGAATNPAPATAPTTSAPAAAAPTWAVSTRLLRTRFESEQMLLALRDAAQRSGQAGGLRLEVLPVGDDWRAIGWPFANRAAAESVRAALAARGLTAQVVTF